MKVRVSWRAAAKYNYVKPQDCPLFHTLKDLGFKVFYVSSGFVRLEKDQDGNTPTYAFNNDSEPDVFFNDHRRRAPTHWNSYTAGWCARRHRSFDVEIPGLEAELSQQQLYKLGYREVTAK